MCGIAGFFTSSTIFLDEAQAVIRAMTDSLYHRGPDGSGTFVDLPVALGHRRLSIIDIAGGQQPMFNEDRQVVVSFNGEIYNFKELKAKLEAKGHVFSSRSDTEVLVHGYEEWGEGVTDRLRGMFAFALYDRKKGRLLLVRDRLGIKPLYYTLVGEDLVFGSEIKALLHYPRVNPSPNPAALASYLSYRYVLGAETLYEGIFKLEPGHCLAIDKEGYEIRQYWDLPAVVDRPDLGEEYFRKRVQELLTESIDVRMISDVPLGAYLSGGLDSSIVVAVMASLSSEPVKTFSIGFEEEGFNEFEYARAVADMYGADHHEIVLPGDQYVENLPNVIRYKDAPLSVPNEVPLYEMSGELKKHITVVLSGEGSDEIFGGYGRIFRSPFDYERMQMLAAGETTLSDIALAELQKNLKDKYGSASFSHPVDHFLYSYDYFGLEDKRATLSDSVWGTVKEDPLCRAYFLRHFDQVAELNPYDQFMWVFEKIHLQGLLARLDTTTMAVSVEARVPFVDHVLVEFMQTVPTQYKLKWKSLGHQVMASLLNSDQISEIYDTPKYILRQAFQGRLPKSVVERKKVGFPVPLHRWFGGKFNGFAKEVLLDGKAGSSGLFNAQTLEAWLSDEERFQSHRFGLKVWMLINVALWYEMYFSRS